MSAPGIGAQFYHRASQRPEPGVAFPGTSFAPDGRMHLAVPVSTSSTGSTGSSGGAAPNPQVGRGDNLVLMQPGAPTAESAPRDWLLFLLVCDAAIIAICLVELHWRTVYADTALAVSITGLVSCALGAVACVKRWPFALGLFATLAAAQFCTNLLLLYSAQQAVHTCLQPLLVRFALLLRRALVPQWFMHGRSPD